MIYQTWQGNNRFCCKGKCVYGPSSDCKYVLLFYFFFAAVTIPYYVSIGIQIKQTKISFLTYIITLFLIITVYFYYRTQLTNPGIVPKKRQIETLGNSSLQILLNSSNADISNYCKICQIFKPNNTYHCVTCNNCIQLYDHHCSFINTCIGKRNFKYFFAFLLSSCMTLNFIIIHFAEINYQMRNHQNIFILSIQMLVLLSILNLIDIGCILLYIFLLIKRKTYAQWKSNIQSLNQQFFDICNSSQPMIDFDFNIRRVYSDNSMNSIQQISEQIINQDQRNSIGNKNSHFHHIFINSLNPSYIN